MNLHNELRRFSQQCLEIDYFVAKALRHKAYNSRAFSVYTAHAIVKLHDAWASRCRELITKSSAGECSTLSGINVARSPVLMRAENPVAWLRNNWTTKKSMPANWEPDWHIPGQAIRAAQLLRVANFTSIFNALSAITITDQLRYTRNAVVHSLPATYKMYRQTARGLGYPNNTKPVDFVYYRIGNTGPMLIDHWIAELTLCLSAAIK